MVEIKKPIQIIVNMIIPQSTVYSGDAASKVKILPPIPTELVGAALASPNIKVGPTIHATLLLTTDCRSQSPQFISWQEILNNNQALAAYMIAPHNHAIAKTVAEEAGADVISEVPLMEGMREEPKSATDCPQNVLPRSK